MWLVISTSASTCRICGRLWYPIFTRLINGSGNVIGTDGYRQTFMDDAQVILAHACRQTICKNTLFKYPKVCNVSLWSRRYAQAGLMGLSGEPCRQSGNGEVPPRRQLLQFSMTGAKFSRCSRIVLARPPSSTFAQHHQKYYSRDFRRHFQRELEAYTAMLGVLQHWLHDKGLID